MKVTRFLRILFIVILLTGFLWKVDLQSFFISFNLQALQSVLLIQPMVLIGLFLSGFRLNFLLGKPGPKIWHTFKAVLLTNGLNCMFPGRVGELVKISYLRERVEVPLSAGMAAVFLERAMDMIFLGIVTLLGISFFFPGFSPFLLIFPALLAGILFSLIHKGSFWRRAAAFIPWQTLRNGVQDIFGHLASRLGETSFLMAVSFGIFTWMLSFATVVLFLYLDRSTPFDFLGTVAIFIAITVGVAIPALPGGFGTYEAAAVFALERFGYSLESALATAVTLHFGQVLAGVVGALIILSREKIGVTTVFRRIAAKAKGNSSGNVNRFSG